MSVTRKKETQTYVYQDHFKAENGRFPTRIVAKVDWFTAMYYDCSIIDVCKVYDLDKYLTVDLLKCYEDRYICETNLGKQIVLQIAPGIRCEVKISLLEKELRIFNSENISYVDLISGKLPSIRFDISGSGLEYLRSIGYDVESRFVVPTYVCDPEGNMMCQAPSGGRMKITRIDIAFDLLNFTEDFFETCVGLIYQYGDRDSARMHMGEDDKCCSKKAYSIRQGRDRTIYLGSPSSDMLCRIYDKGFQFKYGKASIADYPYKTEDGIIPESWIRIELQLRGLSKKCRPDELLHYSKGDYSKMLSYWYYHFALCSQKGSVAESFAAFFDWSYIPAIIQNANYIQVPFTKSERVKRFGYRNLTGLLEALSLMGREFFLSWVSDAWLDLQHSNDLSDKLRVSHIKQRMLLDDNSMPPYVEVNNKGEWVIL